MDVWMSVRSPRQENYDACTVYVEHLKEPSWCSILSSRPQSMFTSLKTWTPTWVANNDHCSDCGCWERLLTFFERTFFSFALFFFLQLFWILPGGAHSSSQPFSHVRREKTSCSVFLCKLPTSSLMFSRHRKRRSCHSRRRFRKMSFKSRWENFKVVEFFHPGASIIGSCLYNSQTNWRGTLKTLLWQTNTHTSAAHTQIEHFLRLLHRWGGPGTGSSRCIVSAMSKGLVCSDVYCSDLSRECRNSCSFRHQEKKCGDTQLSVFVICIVVLQRDRGRLICLCETPRHTLLLAQPNEDTIYEYNRKPVSGQHLTNLVTCDRKNLSTQNSPHPCVTRTMKLLSLKPKGPWSVVK